jgi:hypothetical protein
MDIPLQLNVTRVNAPAFSVNPTCRAPEGKPNALMYGYVLSSLRVASHSKA